MPRIDLSFDQFTRNFEGKWSLIFLIAVPCIEVARCLLVATGLIHPIISLFTRIDNLYLSGYNRLFAGSRMEKLWYDFSPNYWCSRREDTSKTSDMLPVDTPPSCTNQGGAFEYAGNEITDTLLPRKRRLNLDSLNTYDLFKIFATATMLIDHYAYFGLPGLTFTQNAWWRCVGRASAPGFFFLAGFSSHRFRMRLYLAAIFIYAFTTVIPLALVHSPWESIMNVLLINCVFRAIPPHCIRNVLVHLAVFWWLQQNRVYSSTALNIGYGTASWMLAIAGDLAKHKHWLRFPWILASMWSFEASASNVFAYSHGHRYVIIAGAVFNAVVMVLFSIFGVLELKVLNEYWVGRKVRDGLMCFSRAGLQLYIGHLMLYKIVHLERFY